MSIEAKIIQVEREGSGEVRSLLGQIEGVVLKAAGLGEFYSFDPKDPKYFGFRGAWKTNYDIENQAVFTPEFADILAEDIALVTRKKSFGSLETLIIASATMVLGFEKEVRKRLEADYGIRVETTRRHNLACNGGVFALTEAAAGIMDSRVAIGVIENLSPVTKHDEVMANLFGDGYFVGALKSGEDAQVLSSNTMFEADTLGVIRMPHGLSTTFPGIEMLAIEDNKILEDKFEVRGEKGRLFLYEGGIYQPLLNSDSEEFSGKREDGLAVMRGSALAKYFASAPVAVIKNTVEKYQEHHEGKLNKIAVSHEPSQPVYELLVRQLSRANIIKLPEHRWSPGDEKTRLHGNNMSGARVGFALLNAIDLGWIEEGDVLITGFGVGHNITSTVFRFGK